MSHYLKYCPVGFDPCSLHAAEPDGGLAAAAAAAQPLLPGALAAAAAGIPPSPSTLAIVAALSIVFFTAIILTQGKFNLPQNLRISFAEDPFKLQSQCSVMA